MIRHIMPCIGDRVRVNGLTGQIWKIRYDDDNREIYTILLDDPNATPDKWFYYARHEELEWL